MPRLLVDCLLTWVLVLAFCWQSTGTRCWGQGTPAPVPAVGQAVSVPPQVQPKQSPARATTEISQEAKSVAADSVLLRLVANVARAKQFGNDQLKAQAYWELGKSQQQHGLFIEAITQYNAALALGSTARPDTLTVLLKNSIGSIHLEVGQFERAEKFAAEALQLAGQLNFARGKAAALGLKGGCYEKKGNYLEALTAQQASLELYASIGDQAGIALVNENLGSIYEDLQNYPLALDYFRKAYAYLQTRESRNTVNVLNNLGDIYRKQRDYPQGEFYTRQALQLAEKLGDQDELQSAHKDLSKSYALQENYVLAYHHLSEAERHREAVAVGQDLDALNKMQFLAAYNQQEAQINLLEERNKVNGAYQRLQLLAISALLVIFGTWYYYHRRKRKTLLNTQALEKRAFAAELAAKAANEQQLELEVTLKTTSLSSYSLHLAQKNKILLDLAQQLNHLAANTKLNFPQKIKALAKEIDGILAQESEWENFLRLFQDIHPEFINQLLQTAAEPLSPAELRLAVLLKLRLSSKEIAAILRITPDSVRIARYRLRKKLPIASKDELVNFLLGLETPL